MFKSPFVLIEKLINEHGSSVILKERLSLLKDQLTAIERECSELKEKCSHLQEEKAKLTKELNKKIIPSEFTENSGVLFKRNSTGSYIPSAFCPKCKNPLFNSDPLTFPYMCNISGCHFLIHITEPLESIINKLNS